MSVSWQQVEDMIRSKRHSELVVLLSNLDDAGRKSLVAPVRSFSRSEDDRGMPVWDLFTGIALVGAAVMPDTRSVASWIRRFAQHHGLEGGDWSAPDVEAEDLAAILIARNPSWLPNLVNQLADQLRHNVYNRGQYTLVERLRTHLDVAPPDGAGYVAGWAYFGWRNTSLATLLRADPRFADLVPLVMENDDLAETLRGSTWSPGQVHTVTEALDAGLADRGDVLDALLARFQRGGRPKPTNDFVAVHDSLAPSMDEVIERRRDYLALLPAPAQSTVAGMAQRHLLAALAAGRLSIDELEEASRSVLIRKDKKLVRAQLTALRDHAHRVPSDLPRAADMVAMTFDNTAPDLQRDAVNLLAPWLPSLDASVMTRVLERAAALPADLAATLGATPVAPPIATPQLTAPEPTRVVPIDSAEELVEELLLVIRSEAWKIDALAIDRILEAIPRLAGDNQEALRSAAEPILDSTEYAWAHTNDGYSSNWRVDYGLIAALDTALGNPVALAAPDERHWSDQIPQRVVTTRVWAAAKALRASASLRCVSLPSWSDGVIEVSELRERLGEAEREGWTPDPIDLEQATLRIRPTEASTIGLSSPPAPTTTLVERKEAFFPYWDGERPPPPVHLPVPVLTPATDDDSRSELWSLLRSLPAPHKAFRLNFDSEAHFQAWALICPHHADIIAAHLCLEQVKALNGSSTETGVLIGVASAPGPNGAGLHAAIAYGLGAKRSDRQAAAVDALLVLAARNRLDGEALGAILAQIVKQRGLILKRLCTPLTDVARAGAATPAWSAVQAVVEAAIALTPTPSGLPDLLSAASEIATLADTHRPIAGLGDLAARKGTSRQLVEARRLVAILT